MLPEGWGEGPWGQVSQRAGGVGVGVGGSEPFYLLLVRTRRPEGRNGGGEEAAPPVLLSSSIQTVSSRYHSSAPPRRRNWCTTAMPMALKSDPNVSIEVSASLKCSNTG